MEQETGCPHKGANKYIRHVDFDVWLCEDICWPEWIKTHRLNYVSRELVWDECPLMIRQLVPTTNLVQNESGMKLETKTLDEVCDLVRRKYSVN